MVKKSQLVRLLCLSDLHLGREPLAKESQHVQRTWKKSVDFALKKESAIDVVILAGDLVDDEGDFFAGFTALEWGMQQWLDAGIFVVAVAGNHDWQVWPRICQIIDHEKFLFLGKEGMWESKSLNCNRLSLRFDGWSFQEAHFTANPLTNYTLPPPKKGEIAIGVIHCDCKALKSCYAPVSLADFAQKPHCTWVMGHQHKPEVVLKKPFVFYCGSPQGLDPTETGKHGGFVLNLSSDGTLSHQQISFASLLFHTLQISLEGVARENFETHLLETVMEYQKQLQGVEEVALRLCFTGRTSFFSELDQLLFPLIDQELLQKGGTVFWVEGVKNYAAPLLDLMELSQGCDLLSYVAKNLSILQHSSPERKALMKRAREEELHLADLEEEALLEHLTQGGYEVLEQLLASKEGK